MSNTPTLDKWLKSDNIVEAIEKRKAQAVQSALMGLSVKYDSHEGGLTPNMAKVNGYSIIWHQYSYGASEPGKVEILLLDGDCVCIDISELRQRVA